MSFYAIEGDGHTWPGSASEQTTNDIDATIESWNFFLQHSLPTN